MFETDESAEIEILPIFGGHGGRHWSYVRFRLHMPWFHVMYRFEIGEGETISHMIFLSQVDLLLQMAQDEDLEIEEVKFVMPGHMSGKTGWTMESLAEIWRGVEPETEGQTAHAYVMSNGARYLSAGVCDSEAELQNKELIYVAPSKEARKTR